jgi:hypothetical protein
MKNLCVIIVISISLLASSVFASHEGGAGTHGGDFCEQSIGVIRDDLMKWIKGGVPKEIEFEKEWDEQNYSDAMTTILKKGKVVISCIHETKKNSYIPIRVGGVQKTCMNYRDQKGIAHIDCDFEAFLSKSVTQSQRYKLIHHEFASLQGIELSKGPISNYFVSDQISEFVGPETIWKLGIKRRVASIPLNIIDPTSTFESIRNSFETSRVAVTPASVQDAPFIGVAICSDGRENMFIPLAIASRLKVAGPIRTLDFSVNTFVTITDYARISLESGRNPVAILLQTYVSNDMKKAKNFAIDRMGAYGGFAWDLSGSSLDASNPEMTIFRASVLADNSITFLLKTDLMSGKPVIEILLSGSDQPAYCLMY